MSSAAIQEIAEPMQKAKNNDFGNNFMPEAYVGNNDCHSLEIRAFKCTSPTMESIE